MLLFSNFQKDSVVDPAKVDNLVQVIPQVIYEQDLKDLSKTISIQEVETFVFSFRVYKVLGPDGFPPTLF